MEAKTDRRIKRTRYLLVHALTSLMLKKSIKDITVKELCESVCFGNDLQCSFY
jgi:hypothetical protein